MPDVDPVHMYEMQTTGGMVTLVDVRVDFSSPPYLLEASTQVARAHNEGRHNWDGLVLAWPGEFCPETFKMSKTTVNPVSSLVMM